MQVPPVSRLVHQDQSTSGHDSQYFFNEQKKSNVYIDSSMASKSFLNQHKDLSPSNADYVETTRHSRYSVERTAENRHSKYSFDNRTADNMTIDTRQEIKRESEVQVPVTRLSYIPVRSASSDHKLSDWVIERMREHESRNGVNPQFNYGIARPMQSHIVEYRR